MVRQRNERIARRRLGERQVRELAHGCILLVPRKHVTSIQGERVIYAGDAQRHGRHKH